MRICFTFHGIHYCFNIPLLINRWWWLQPDPGPEGPQPDPWLTRNGLEVEAARDLQVLATINALTHSLSEGPRSALRSGFDHAVEQVKAQLPEGFEIHSAAAPTAR